MNIPKTFGTGVLNYILKILFIMDYIIYLSLEPIIFDLVIIVVVREDHEQETQL